MFRKTVAFTAIALVFGTSTAVAQKLIVTPFAGYRIGGSFPDGIFTMGADLDVFGVQLTNGFDVGLIADVPITEFVQLEFLLDYQASSVRIDSTRGGTGPSPEFDVGVSYIQGGAIFEKPGKVAPFFAFSLGATYFNPAGSLESETRFSGGFSLGARTFFSERFGARFDGRLISTNLGKTNRGFCNADDNCFVWANTTLLTQISFTVGLMVIVF